MKKPILCAALAGMTLAMPFAASANLILNGGFEDPAPASPYQYRTGNEITDWFITSSVVQFDASYNPVGVPNYSVQLETGVGGGIPASIEQTFSTVAGATYYVSFLLASYNGGPASMNVTIDAFAQNYISSSTTYASQSFSFVADDLSATLNFANAGPHGVSFPQLDSVSVVVPEPTTVIAGAMLLLPFGASTLRIIRRNRKA